ncbi:LytTR family DNA-binding domain-containing protein [Anaerotignum sp.]
MNIFSTSDHKDHPLPSHCHINTTKGIYNIPFEDIFFIESRQKKSLIHTKTGILTLHLPLYRIKESLPSAVFLQSHRSFLVNLKNISHIDKQKEPWTVFFFGYGEQAFISRSYRHQVMDAVND